MTDLQYKALIDAISSVNKNLYEIRKQIVIYGGIISGVLVAIAIRYLWLGS